MSSPEDNACLNDNGTWSMTDDKVLKKNDMI
jgi:hypothetical protein